MRDDKTGAPLVDKVLDVAGQKGTGKWSAQIALDLGVPIPTINAAIDARLLSTLKEERVGGGVRCFPGPKPTRRSAALLEAMPRALYAAKLCSYAQGMALIAAGSREYKWNVDLEGDGAHLEGRLHHPRAPARGRHARVRAARRPAEPAPRRGRAARACSTAQAALRALVGARAGGAASPVPAFSARRWPTSTAIARPSLPQNLTQAQRDAFGAHTYQRNDVAESAVRAHRVAPDLG